MSPAQSKSDKLTKCKALHFSRDTTPSVLWRPVSELCDSTAHSNLNERKRENYFDFFFDIEIIISAVIEKFDFFLFFSFFNDKIVVSKDPHKFL